LLWFADATGQVHADSAMAMGRGVNVGDPRMTHVDVYEAEGVPRRCPSCDLRVYGSKVQIRDGIISGVDALLREPRVDLAAVVFDPKTGEESEWLSNFTPLGVMP